MAPRFADGDFVFALRWPGWRVKTQQVVLVRHDHYGLIIKRIARLDDNAVQLAGDNPQSTSSEAMGWIPCDRLLRVYWHVRRPDSVIE